jgi:hypothetical protein
MLNTNTKIANNYYNYIKNLDPNTQLELVEKISKSLKKRIFKSNESIKHLFGAWEGNETAEDLIFDIKKSRKFNRKTEKL